MLVTVVGLFETPHEAELVVNALVDDGVTQNQISLIMPDETAKPKVALSGDAAMDEMASRNESSQTARRVKKGMGAGAIAGGALGLLIGLGSFTIPGLGPILAFGPAIAALEGAGFGAIAGGIAGTLVDIGVPDAKAEFFTDRLAAGHALVLVRTDEADADRVHTIFEEHGAIETAEKAEPGLDLGLSDRTQAMEATSRDEANRPVPPV